MTKWNINKHKTFGHVYGESIKTPPGRLCWTYLTKPKDPPPPKEGQPQQGTPRFECTILIDKKNNKAFCSELKEMTDQMLELFNKGRTAKLGDCQLFGKWGDGDTADMEKYPFYKNNWVLVARNAQVPKVVGPDRQPVEVGKIVGGIEGRFVITPLITANGGISYKLEAVQFLKDDGTRFGGAQRDAVALFDACEEETEEEAEETEEAEEQETVSKTKKGKKGKDAAVDLL